MPVQAELSLLWIQSRAFGVSQINDGMGGGDEITENLLANCVRESGATAVIVACSSAARAVTPPPFSLNE